MSPLLVPEEGCCWGVEEEDGEACGAWEAS